MKRPLEHEYDSYISYSIALNKYCDKLDAEIERLRGLLRDVVLTCDWHGDDGLTAMMAANNEISRESKS